MSDKKNLNERGNHQGEFTQGVGGWAEYTVHMTETPDTVRHDITVPPGKVVPVIFLPGVMGSNLRMTKQRQEKLERPDNRAWRPDDLLDKSGKAAIVTGTGMGGWLKNATPKERQLIFDPNETEVEYYHYTENKGRFDPEGEETLAADARHQNIPDDLEAIPPLISNRASPAGKRNGRGTEATKKETPAQIARWRGWSEVLFAGAYGDMLKTAEKHLNNMLIKGKINPIWRDVCADPKSFGAAGGVALTEADIRKIAPCWYPVHAMGYNFMVSNAETAVVLAERIRGLVKGYQSRGFRCNEVIIVTHSMGGLVGRALLHPDYGNMLNDKSVKVLGMYHNVMPTMGAACAYKRMRFGFKEDWGYVASLEASILAIDGKHATAILANTPAPLELLPSVAYGQDWLKVVDVSGKTLWSWPRGNLTALDSIYLQPPSAWWRMINPKWINPANISKEKGGGLARVTERLRNAIRFVNSIEHTFHPTNCYASFCASPEQRSYGEVVFKAAETWTPFTKKSGVPLPPPETWQLLTDDAKGMLKVQAGDQVLALYLQKPNAAGDQTVPSERSACKIKGTLFMHGEKAGPGYEHQASYSDSQVLTSMIYAISQIAKTAKWE
jgi:hypothetical protein